MDRINIKCLIDGFDVELQLDKKAMPGEAGPSFMISDKGCFKGYITRQQNGDFKWLGHPYYSEEDLSRISASIGRFASK